MAKTKLDVKNELIAAVDGNRSFSEMIDSIATYIVRNYRLKKVIVTTTTKTLTKTLKSEGIRD